MYYELIIVFKKESFNPKKKFFCKILEEIGNKNVIKKYFIKDVKINLKKEKNADFFFMFFKKKSEIKFKIDKNIKYVSNVLRHILINVSEKKVEKYIKKK
ncbi:hypothetical protein ACWNX6_00560 [Candidatus Vidania fulgoroideorum]